MGLFSKIKKGITKTVKSTWSATAPIVTGTLIKPEKLGIKSESQQKIFDTVTKGTRVVAAGTAATFTLAGAPVALGGAGVGSGGLLGTTGGPMAFLSGIFGKKTTPAVPLSQSGMPTGAPHEPTSTFGSSYNQRLETLGQVDPTGGFGGQIPVVGGLLQNKMVLFGLAIAVLLAGILVFRRK